MATLVGCQGATMTLPMDDGGAPPDMGDGGLIDEDPDGGPTDCEEPDQDGDGHDAVACGGDDCDDLDASRFPGNVEICDASGHDEDCDDSTFGPDGDGDGFIGAECCNGDACGDDCDDTLAGVNPGATDGCGGGDEDCDEVVDEEPDATFYRDADSDTRPLRSGFSPLNHQVTRRYDDTSIEMKNLNRG